MTLPDISQIEYLREHEPDKYFELVAKLASELSPDAVREQRLDLLAEIARSGETLEAFEAFYEGIHDAPMLPHLLEMEKDSFRAKSEGRIWMCLGFRGSRKTTTDQITKKAWLHGLFPEKTGVITGANDINAKLIAKSIAEIIEKHPFFKRCFPHVVVYKERGWGAEGYWVRQTKKRVVEGDSVRYEDITVEQWTAQQVKVNDPSFVGGGYKSSEINGKHPTLYLGVDDLHDIDSSSSVTERESISNVFFFQILPTIPRLNDKYVAWIDITGVPFSDNDTYAQVVKMGAVFTKIPVMTRTVDGKGTYISKDEAVHPDTGIVYEDLVGWWILTSPELFGVKSIVAMRFKKAVFYQMYMIDINLARSAGLVYYEYPPEEIGFNLPTVGGVDPSGIDPDEDVGGSKRSSFALAYLCKLPQGGGVVKDGVLKPMGFRAAKDAMLQAQTMFPNWETTGIEDVSYGKSFMQYLRTADSNVRFVKSNLKDIESGKIRDKKTRFLNEVHPYIESGLIRISKAKTPFLDALRYLMDNFWDIDGNKPHESLDAGDALYHAVKLIPEILRKTSSDDLSPAGMRNQGGLWHPFMGVGNGKY